MKVGILLDTGEASVDAWSWSQEGNKKSEIRKVIRMSKYLFTCFNEVENLQNDKEKGLKAFE